MKWGGNMRSILMLVINNIKRKRLMNGLIFFIIFLGSFMFASAFNIMDAIKEPFRENHKSLNGFHLCIIANADLDKEDKVFKWVKEQDGIEDISKSYSYQVNPNLFIQEIEEADQKIDKVKIVEGKEKKSPEEGELWVSTKYSKQENLSIGDKVRFNIEGKDVEFIVNAIVVEAEFSSPMNNEIRGFVKKGYIQENIKKGLMERIDIRFKDEFKLEENTKNLLDNLYDKFGELVLSRSKISNIEIGYNQIFNIIGGVLMAIALLIIMFVIVVIYFTISEMLLSDFKTIGVLETVGFSKINILSSYIFQFLLITALAIPIAITGSYYGVKYLLKDIFYTYGFLNINIKIEKVSIVTCLTIIGIIFIGATISSLKVMKVNVVEAISKGSAVKNSGNNIFTIDRFKNMPMCLVLTFKNIFWRWRESLLLIIIILIGVFGVISSLNIRNSFNNMYKNAENFGLEKSNITIKAKDKVDKNKVEEALVEIRKDKDIEKVFDFILYGGLKIDKTEKMSLRVNSQFCIYSENLDDLTFKNCEGKHPKNKYEIELSSEMAKSYGKGIGDYITFIINGEKKDFLIVGLFDILMDPQTTLRTSYELFKQVDPKIDSKILKYHSSIMLKDEKKIGEMINKLNKEYGELFEITEGNVYIKDCLKETSKIVSPITLTITFVFLMLSIICVFNFIVINIYNEKKTLGIYSVLGVERRDLVSIAFNKVILFYFIAVMVVLPMVKALDEYIMVSILKGFGIRSFDIIPEWKLNFIFLGLMGVLYIISALVSSKVVLSIDEKILVSD